jgi:hypothetical protein
MCQPTTIGIVQRCHLANEDGITFPTHAPPVTQLTLHHCQVGWQVNACYRWTIAYEIELAFTRTRANPNDLRANHIAHDTNHRTPRGDQ